MNTIIIAEIGECFNGDLKRAKKMIAVAKEAGCDIAKFQTLDYENIAEDDPERDWFKKIALDPKKIEYLVNCAKKINMQILFTPENTKTALWFLNAGLTSIKIASPCIVDGELLDFVNNHFSQVFISTGMAMLEEVKEAIGKLSKVQDLYIMHCVSEYPLLPDLKTLAPEDVRLTMMQMLKDLFPGHKVGYSDHTVGFLASVAAVAMGAKVIEKHITLDRKKPLENLRLNKEYLGIDHIISLEPKELREMVRQIREVEKMLGDGKWVRSKREQEERSSSGRM